MKKGFTLIELLIVISVVMILVAISFPMFSFFRKESELNSASEEIISILRIAQNRTISSKQANSWGVYFNRTTSPESIILFKGKSYATRESGEDKRALLPLSVEMFEIDFQNIGSEVIFERITGKAIQVGHIAIRIINDPRKERLICIEPYIIGLCQGYE